MYQPPRYGQHLTHAHNHITRAVAAMDSYFVLIGAHQLGIAVGPKNGENPVYERPFTAEASAKHSLE